MSLKDVYSNQIANKGGISSLHTSNFHKSEIIKDPKFKQLTNNTLQSILNAVQEHEQPAILPIQTPVAPVTIVSFEQALKELNTQKNI